MALGFGDAPHLQRESHVVQHRQMWKQRVGLKHHRGTAVGRRQVGDVARADDDVAGRDRFMTRDHAQSGSLATAGRPQQAAIRTRRNFEIDGVDGCHVAVDLRQLHEF
jgi:hypothetical protein